MMPPTMDTSYLTTQVTTIIGQLHTIFDEIGVPRNDREARETELFAALSETLHNQLRLVNSEKTKMTEEAHNIIKTIKQMESSLDDEKDRGYDLGTDGLRVTFPLNECLRDLKEKYNTVSRLHRERFEQVKKLVQALESYSSHLEASFIKIRLPPTSAGSCPPNFDLSPSYVTTLDEEFTRVYDEYNKRANLVQTIAEEVIRLWSELGIPQAQTDSSIVQNYRDSPEQLGLHQSDVDRLRSRRDKLLDEKNGREKRLKETKALIESLWNRLGVEEADRKAFLASNRGCGLRTINEFEDELARLNELKRQNLHLFVEDARVRLQELWDSLYFSEEEMLDFTPAFSDVYSDALLSAHEAEIERLNSLKEQRAPVLAMIEKHRSLIGDREALAASANDASRLIAKKGEKRDPTRLLREEKMRKRIAKELPKVTAELVKILENYEDEFGRPFCVHGDRYLDEIAEAEARAPPPRSKTPSGLPPRSKTPSNAAPAMKTITTTTTRSVPLARPGSSMKGPAPARSNSNKTPTRYQPESVRSQAPPSVASAATASHIRSPSKIPSRVPLGSLQNGHNNSPERRAIPQPAQSVHQNYAQTAKTMGPPRAPPPKMRDLFVQPPGEGSAPSYPQAPQQYSQHQSYSQPPQSYSQPPQQYTQPPQRPTSVVSSSDSNASSRFIRPMSPEDVYDDRERMSYMSTSVLGRERQYQQDFHSSLQHHPPPTVVSRQTSNTSSNMTTGTTASGSENWETYSDASELEPEREVREAQYAKVQSAGGKRMGPAHAFAYGQGQVGMGMAPPAKMRYERIEEGDENARAGPGDVRIEGSDAAWSTEQEETY